MKLYSCDLKCMCVCIVKSLKESMLLLTTLYHLLELQFLCECLMHKEDSGCCGSTHIKCWSHYLKNAIIENFGENKVEMPLNQDTPFDELDNVKDVRLKLLWQS